MEGWTKRFYEEVLGNGPVEIDSPRAGARRYGLEGCGGRMELDVRPEVVVPDYHTKAKRYPGPTTSVSSTWT